MNTKKPSKKHVVNQEQDHSSQASLPANKNHNSSGLKNQETALPGKKTQQIMSGKNGKSQSKNPTALKPGTTKKDALVKAQQQKAKPQTRK